MCTVIRISVSINSTVKLSIWNWNMPIMFFFCFWEYRVIIAVTSTIDLGKSWWKLEISRKFRKIEKSLRQIQILSKKRHEVCEFAMCLRFNAKMRRSRATHRKDQRSFSLFREIEKIWMEIKKISENLSYDVIFFSDCHVTLGLLPGVWFSCE